MNSIRSLAKSPGFTLAVVLILAVGIGATTAMFTVLDGVVLKPLGYPEAGRIVTIQTRWTDTGKMASNMTGGDEIDVSGRRDIFEAFAYYHGGEIGVQLGDHAEFAGIQLVHPDFFQVFDVQPLSGRLFNRSDATQSAIVSIAFAERNYGSASGALGRPVFIENRSYQIVGVMPDRMRFPDNTEIWAADSVEPQNRNRTGFNYKVVGKLASGISFQEANGRLAALALQVGSVFPDTNRSKTFEAQPLRDSLVSRVRSTLLVMMGAVVFVLLIACANVANLMLARVSSRSREIAIRAALGARRRHLIGQSLSESLLLASTAGAIGIAIAEFGTSALLSIGTRYVPVPRIHDIHVDWRVLVFAVSISMLTAIVFGLAPVYEISRVGIRDAITRAGSRGHVGAGRSRMRNALVIAQVALSFMLAINAGLLLRSFAALTDAPLGFRSDHVLIAYAHAPAQGSVFDQSGLAKYIQAGQDLDDIVDRLTQAPGVVSTGAVMGLPTGQYDASGFYAIEGKHPVTGDMRLLPHSGFRLNGPGYFAAMGIPLLRGRDFSRTDLNDQQPVAIVSEALVMQIFGQDDPIGHRIMWGLDLPMKWATIVGVVADVRQASPAASPEAQIYMPLRQHPYAANEIQIVLRTDRLPESLIPTVRDVVRTVNPAIATRFTTMEASVSDSIAAPRFRTTLVSTFASIALLLAAAGMYAVMSYGTARRRPEFAVRIALGAQLRGIVGLVLGGALRLAAMGVALGLVLALATNRIISSMLFGIDTTDVMTYAAVLLAILPVIIMAAIIPALRAARVDPITALRMD